MKIYIKMIFLNKILILMQIYKLKLIKLLKKNKIYYKTK